MSSTTLVPVEEYLRYSEKPNCEYREGVLYPKAKAKPEPMPMPTTFHGLLEFMLVVMLRNLGLQAAPRAFKHRDAGCSRPLGKQSDGKQR